MATGRSEGRTRQSLVLRARRTRAAWSMARTIGMVTLAAFGILVLLPAAIAAQASLAW